MLQILYALLQVSIKEFSGKAEKRKRVFFHFWKIGN